VHELKFSMCQCSFVNRSSASMALAERKIAAGPISSRIALSFSSSSIRAAWRSENSRKAKRLARPRAQQQTDRKFDYSANDPILTLDDRAQLVRPTVSGGQSVKIAQAAYAKRTTHRSTTGNHFVSQVLSYRPGAKGAAQELVAAFVLGVEPWKRSRG
jgi:hypothetical protein